MKIAFLEIEDWEIPAIEKQLAGHELAFYHEHIDTKPTSDGFLTPIASPVVTPEVSTVTSTSPFVSQISIFLIALEDNGKSERK